MTTLQFTLFSTTGKYRPLSTTVRVESVREYNLNKKEFQSRALTKIMSEKKCDTFFFKQYGYTKLKVRVYDREKIAQEKAERYEQIKKERGWS